MPRLPLSYTTSDEVRVAKPNKDGAILYDYLLGKQTLYDLKKEHGVGSIRGAYSRLKKANYIKDLPKGKRGKLPSTLTAIGVSYALWMNRNIIDDPEFPAIAKRWGTTLPLVLGKWSYYRKRGVEDLAKTRLSKAIIACLNPPETFYESEEEFVNKFTNCFHEPIILWGSYKEQRDPSILRDELLLVATGSLFEFSEFWVKRISTDADLRKYLQIEFAEFENEVNEERIYFEKLTGQIHRLRELLE